MTTLKKILWASLLSVLFVPVVSGQTYQQEEETSTNGNTNIIQGEQVSPEIMANLGILTTPNPDNARIQGNSVFVQQIGEFNTSTIVTNTNASDINLLQNGDSNDANLNYTANTVFADLVQNGDNNRIRDFVNNPAADASLELTQDGSFLNFEREGVNDLTKSIKFRQTEGTPSLIIRSFN